MAETPIPEQPGLSKEQLDSMKPVEQIYKESGNTNIVGKLGVEKQKQNISNKIHKILSTYFKRLEKMDSKDEYAKEKELTLLANDLADFTCETVAAQLITITTKIQTTDTITGTATNVQSGVTSPMVVTGTGEGNGNSTLASAS